MSCIHLTTLLTSLDMMQSVCCQQHHPTTERYEMIRACYRSKHHVNFADGERHVVGSKSSKTSSSAESVRVWFTWQDDEQSQVMQ